MLIQLHSTRQSAANYAVAWRNKYLPNLRDSALGTAEFKGRFVSLINDRALEHDASLNVTELWMPEDEYSNWLSEHAEDYR